jgi:hypothetical protein
MSATTPRVDINRDVVAKAKQAMMLRITGSMAANEKDLEKIAFSTTLATAAESYRERIVSLLRQAGFRKHPPITMSEKRPRRVDAALWEELGEVAKEQGIARVELVRALFVLLGNECDHRPQQAAQSASPKTASLQLPETADPEDA